MTNDPSQTAPPSPPPTGPDQDTIASARDVLKSYRRWLNAGAPLRNTTITLTTDLGVTVESLLDLIGNINATGVSAGGITGATP